VGAVAAPTHEHAERVLPAVGGEGAGQIGRTAIGADGSVDGVAGDAAIGLRAGAVDLDAAGRQAPRLVLRAVCVLRATLQARAFRLGRVAVADEDAVVSG